MFTHGCQEVIIEFYETDRVICERYLVSKFGFSRYQLLSSFGSTLSELTIAQKFARVAWSLGCNPRAALRPNANLDELAKLQRPLETTCRKRSTFK
jgi:hypothetical protein